MRNLHPYEDPLAAAVISLGAQTRWEFAAFLESPDGPLVEMRTSQQGVSAEPLPLPTTINPNPLSPVELLGNALAVNIDFAATSVAATL